MNSTQTRIHIGVALLVVLSLIGGCSTHLPVAAPATNEVGSIVLQFDNIVGDRQMMLDGAPLFVNAAGERFNLTTFRYYVSNIILERSDGRHYVVPQDSSYFLIDESNSASQFVTIPNVPAGDYTDVHFTIGVDSARNMMDISRRGGALDPANGMYWTWNSGYIFLMMEGQTSASPNGSFRYHIGGFGGVGTAGLNNLKDVTLSFNGYTATVRSTITPTVHLIADAMAVFNGINPIRIADHSTVMFDTFSSIIATNYSSMFSVDHVHNN